MFISGIQKTDPKACPADKQTATQHREQSQFSQRRAERNPGWNGLTPVIATSRIKGHHHGQEDNSAPGAARCHRVHDRRVVQKILL